MERNRDETSPSGCAVSGNLRGNYSLEVSTHMRPSYLLIKIVAVIQVHYTHSSLCDPVQSKASSIHSPLSR